MGKDTGFLEYGRELAPRRPVTQRVNDWFEIYLDFPEEKLRTQGARCMDCGVPFCHTGCPVNNLIPDWNDLVYRGRWKEAVRQLHATNNFPEFTGRICPAPCEASCVLGINQPAVTIKQIEKNIVERGFAEGWIKPELPKIRTGKKVAIVGSGPAGLAAAQQLCRAGHSVVVYEKSDRLGGLLRYGIPQFKLEKHIVDRRLEQMSAEGVKFVTSAEVGKNIAVEELQTEFDAIVLAGGAEHPRDLPVPGRELKGIHFAMEFLAQSKSTMSRRPHRSGSRNFRGRQTCRHHRRRRHRRRLPRYLPPAKAALRASVRDHAEAARRPFVIDAMATLADATPHRGCARRRWNP